MSELSALRATRATAPVERLIGVAEAAKLLGMSERTVQLKAQRRQIGHVRDGRLIKFRARHIAEYIAAHEQPAIPAQVPARPKR
ncbi:MAG TPA: helix-turn-helix domain-containing protein [Actinospica sp.]|jgi:excisionase family DNA binding protein|nr:helix-turn-helix domain-containing protein [Actinospica sp.]